MNGALPPSSSDTFFTPPAHWAIKSFPTSVDPLNPSLRTIELEVSARPISGELVAENNVFSTVLDVRPGPARVLYVEGEPRPEFPFLRRAVAGDSAVQVVGLMRSAEHMRKLMDQVSERVEGGSFKSAAEAVDALDAATHGLARRMPPRVVSMIVDVSRQ